MKLSFLICLVAFLQVSASSLAQKVNLNKQRASLRETLNEIQKQTGFNILVDADLLDNAFPVTINAKDMELEEVLKQCFRLQPFVYVIEKNTILVRPVPATVEKAVPLEITGKVTDERQEPIPGVTVKVKNTQIAVLTDKDGLYKITIPSESAVLVYSSIGYKSREVSPGRQSTLNVTLQEQNTDLNEVVVIGYGQVNRKELTGAVSSINAKALKDIPLNSAAEALQGKLAGVQITVSEGTPGAAVDVFIRGRNSITQSGSPLYVVDGVQVENALSVLSPQDIESIDVLKDAASTAIYGARGSNGVVIITTKGGKNTKGKIQVSYNGFIGLNKLSKELDMMDPYNFVLYEYEMAKYSGSATDAGSVARYIGDLNGYSKIAGYNNYPQTVDWQKKMMGRNAFQATNNVSLSGGTDNLKFNLSLTNNQQQGLLLNSDYGRNLINLRLEPRISSKVTSGFNIRYNQQAVLGAGTSDAGSAGGNRLRQYVRYRPMDLPGQTDDYYDQTLSDYNPGNGLNLINPTQLSKAEYRRNKTTAYNVSGYINYNITKHLSLKSTLGYDHNELAARAFDDTITTNAKNNGARMPIATLSGTIKSTVDNANVLTYDNPSLFNSKHGLNVLIGHELYTSAYQTNTATTRYFPVGTTADAAFANLGLATPPVGAVQPKPSSSAYNTRQVSFFSRITYNYAQKYILTVNLRADGSSLFGPDYSNPFVASTEESHKWSYFPSASFAWRIFDEGFFKKMPVISDAKLRLSYGTSGNNRIDPYGYTTGYIIPSNAGYGLNDMLNYTLTLPTRLGNPDIKWETLTSANIGLDVGLFHDRLTASIDLYTNTTKNLLIENKYPASSGYVTQYQNVGSTRNRGLEIQLNAAIIRTKAFSWSGNFNISFNKNKITSLGSVNQFTASSGFLNTAGNPDDYLVKVGNEVGTMYGLKVDGFYHTSDFNTKPYVNAANNALYPGLTYQYTLKDGYPNPSAVLSALVQPGQVKYRDVNGDGVINLDDRTVIGHALPKFTGGFGQQFTYKNFDLNAFFTYSYGNDIYNANKLEFSSSYGVDANLLAVMDNRWKLIDGQGNLVQKQLNATTVIGIAPDALEALNANASIWTPFRTTLGFYPSSYAIEDGSYLRLSTLTLGYKVPNKLRVFQAIGISTLRVYCTANNLATITGYSGYDPDVSSRRSILTPGMDYAAYPRGRTYVFGVNVGF